MTSRLPIRVLILASVFALPCSASAQQFTTYKDARNAGVKLLNMGKLAEAQPALETALELAKTDAERFEANRTLMTPYRELPVIEPMQRAAEYVITHSKQTAEQSLARRALLAFIHKRGKMDEAVKGYEAQLKKDADDRTVTYLLLEAYTTHTPNAGRAAELGTRLLALDKKAGVRTDVFQQSQIAMQFVKAGKVKEGAALYEEIAPLDDTLAASNLKDAAAAWLKAGDKAKAIAAARKAAAGTPEKRNDQLAYFWHRGLGDVFLDAGEPAAAVPHFEKAIGLTKIDGYVQDTRKKLAQAKAAAGM